MHSNLVFLAQAVPDGRVFGLDTQTLISIGIQLLNGIVLAVLLSLILYKPVKEFMGKRTDKIQDKIEDADITMAKANELISEYNIKLKQIDKERLEVLETARLKAIDEGRIILEEAKKEADEIKKGSFEDISEERKRLREETRLYVIELASLIARKHISKNIDDEIQDKIFDETLGKMENARWQV